MSPLGFVFSVESARFVGQLAFHSLPIAAYACLSRRVPLVGRMFGALAYAAVVALLFRIGPRSAPLELLGFLVGLAYFALGAAVTQGLRVLLVARRIGKLALIAVVAVAFVLVPGLLSREPYRFAVLLAGWEAMFSAYSYCVDTERGPRPSLRECIAFIVVNPVVVFAQRGRVVHEPRLSRAGLLRTAGGIAILGIQALLAVLAAFMHPVDLREIDGLAGYRDFLLYYGLAVLIGYCTHSGRASLQIGLMRLLGHELPERYHYPLGAASPLAFWRRWNIYVGTWFQRYVFVPLVLRWRRLGQLPADAAVAGAVLVTFGATGLAHDYVASVRSMKLQSGWLLLFFVQAVALVLWLLGARALRALAERFSIDSDGWLHAAAVSLSRLCFWQFLCVSLWLARVGLALPPPGPSRAPDRVEAPGPRGHTSRSRTRPWRPLDRPAAAFVVSTAPVVHAALTGAACASRAFAAGQPVAQAHAARRLRVLDDRASRRARTSLRLPRARASIVQVSIARPRSSGA